MKLLIMHSSPASRNFIGVTLPVQR